MYTTFETTYIHPKSFFQFHGSEGRIANYKGIDAFMDLIFSMYTHKYISNHPRKPFMLMSISYFRGQGLICSAFLRHLYSILWHIRLDLLIYMSLYG